MSQASFLHAPIGLLGGTFDPVHNGHLAIATAVAQQLALDDMRLMPNPKPPHRETPVLQPDVRIQALQLALRDAPGLSLELSEWQAFEKGETDTTYTVDSLQRLRRHYPQRPLVFVMGADAYAGIADWQQAERLPQLCHLVVVNRPACSQVYEGLAGQWLQQYAVGNSNDINVSLAGSVRQLTAPEVDVSATHIRQLIAAGKTPAGLVPKAILKFLEPNL